jgi:hypothetical protein
MRRMEAEVPDDETVQSILDLVVSAWRARLLDARWLPDISAELLAAGLDSPSLIDLAGLDFAPFDPRDAGDLLVASFDELGLPTPDLRDALITTTLLVAWALATERLLPRYAAQWAARTYIAADYPDAPRELATLFTLDDEYDQTDYGWWHRSIEDIDSDVRTVVQGLLTGHNSPRWLTQPVATRIVELILPSL